MDANKAAGVDFETYYDKTYSLKNMSPWAYCHHERFDPYLVALHNDDTHFVGHPDDAPWDAVNGIGHVMHNASFDDVVMKTMQEQGRFTGIKPAFIFDTADMVAYLNCKRNLKDSAKALLGIEADKTVRDRMKGLTFTEAQAQGLETELLAYGGEDARLCYELWRQHQHRWPESEQEISRLNREANSYGVMVNVDYARECIARMEAQLEQVESTLPWVAEGYKPLSPKAVRAWAQRPEFVDADGEPIPIPASLAKTNQDWIRTIKEHGERHPWLNAIGAYRSLNAHLCKARSVLEGIRPDGTYPMAIKYFGAGNTGRFSGGSSDGSGSKFNPQNMPQQEMFGCDLRHFFISRPGKKLILADYSQVEYRILLWLVGDVSLTEAIKREGNLYQAYAKVHGIYTGSGSFKQDDPEGYKKTKGIALGLGYQMGSTRYAALTGMSAQQAAAEVTSYRDKNPLIVKHWAGHQYWLKRSAMAKDPTHEVALRSGRILTYLNPRPVGRDFKAQTVFDGNFYFLHSGVLTNNEVQGTARDILCDAWRALEAAGVRVLWTVHDEFICEVDAASAESDAEQIARIMVSASPWAEGCPLGVEYQIADYYTK